jgi:hypothetical protein
VVFDRHRIRRFSNSGSGFITVSVKLDLQEDLAVPIPFYPIKLKLEETGTGRWKVTCIGAEAAEEKTVVSLKAVREDASWCTRSDVRFSYLEHESGFEKRLQVTVDGKPMEEQDYMED